VARLSGNRAHRSTKLAHAVSAIAAPPRISAMMLFSASSCPLSL
jgi:hypothetical protein